MTVNLITELQRLAIAHPAVDAPDWIVVGWYVRKADLLEQLGHHVDAEQARAHARRLGDYAVITQAGTAVA